MVYMMNVLISLVLLVELPMVSEVDNMGAVLTELFRYTILTLTGDSGYSCVTNNLFQGHTLVWLAPSCLPLKLCFGSSTLKERFILDSLYFMSSHSKTPALCRWMSSCFARCYNHPSEPYIMLTHDLMLRSTSWKSGCWVSSFMVSETLFLC